MVPEPHSLVPEKPARFEWLLTLGLAALLVVVSTFVMLESASPEFCWDEADYSSSLSESWWSLWAHADYCRHGHGPLLIYLEKLGQDFSPAWLGTLETRLRLFDAFVASFAVGIIYASLRHLFQTSRAAALVGASLFLFSGSRVLENNIIGPHGLMAVCSVALIALGYYWRDRPSLVAALGLAAVLVYGAMSMSYVIPVAVCFAFAILVGGKGWFVFDRAGFKISWYVPVTVIVAGVVFAMLWPGGINPREYPKDFLAYAVFRNRCCLVGNHFVEVTPRWAALYWLAELDPVFLLVAAGVLGLFGWRVYRGAPFTSGHRYLAAGVFAFTATLLTAHLAGARNLLQFLGVACLAIGAVFDEALGYKPLRAALWSLAIVVAAGLGLFWCVRFSSYTPALAVNGYKACLLENRERMSEKVGAIVFGVPDLQFYSGVTHVPVAWQFNEMPAQSLLTDVTLTPDIKYVLLPSFVYEGMPPDHNLRKIVGEHWKVVWTCKTNRVWDLRLFERPDSTSP